ncbi:MAG: ArsR/SmtB family transcription factor [Candidatus Bathyarchaeia archaeon]
MQRKNNAIMMARVQRLISSNLCDAENPSEYVAQLEQLVANTIDEDAVKRQANLFKALSEPLRLKILELLKVREMCLCEIMTAFNLAQPTASHHLEILEKAGIVESRREGKWVFFKFSKPAVMAHIRKISFC